MSVDRVKDIVRALLDKTTARGCTEAEALAAAAKAADLMQRHGLSNGDLNMGTEDAPHKTRRATYRDHLWGTLARCTNTVAVYDGIRSTMVFIGHTPGPEVAAYLKVVCDRAIDGAISHFKMSAFYRRRRTMSTKRKAVAEFTLAMVARLQNRLYELFDSTISETAIAEAEAYCSSLYPDLRTRRSPKIKGGSIEARAAGWSAGAEVGLHHGMSSSAPQPALLPNPYNEASR